MRFAIINHDKVHQIIEQAKAPVFPPDPQGNRILVKDITRYPKVQLGWDYNEKKNVFTAPIIPEPKEPVYYALLNKYGVIIDILPYYNGEEPTEPGSFRAEGNDTALIGELCIDGNIITKARMWETIKNIESMLEVLTNAR